jgi:hypothetical protein
MMILGLVGLRGLGLLGIRPKFMLACAVMQLLLGILMVEEGGEREQQGGRVPTRLTKLPQRGDNNQAKRGRKNKGESEVELLYNYFGVNDSHCTPSRYS